MAWHVFSVKNTFARFVLVPSQVYSFLRVVARPTLLVSHLLPKKTKLIATPLFVAISLYFLCRWSHSVASGAPSNLLPCIHNARITL